MQVPNWKHHSKKEQKRKLKPQALRQAKARRQAFKKKHSPKKECFFFYKYLKSISKMDAQDFRSLQEAYMEVVENQQLGEAEGSYGQTPKARQAMGQLAIARRSKPASEYSQKGEKTKKVKEIEKHTRRIDNGPDVGNRGKRSTPSSRMYSNKRGKLDQDSRDHARDSAVEYTAGGHKPGPGTVTKNPKKLRKQRAMGEIGENYDIYDIILSHLLDEGYAETPEAAEAIMVNMSEEWRDSIIG